MSDLKPRGVPIILGGEERHLLITLNLIDELQDRHGKPIDDIMGDMVEGDVAGHALRDLVAALLNDEAEREERKGHVGKYRVVTERDVGEMIGMDNYYQVMAAVLQAYGVSMPEPEEGGSPNGEGGQTSP